MIKFDYNIEYKGSSYKALDDGRFVADLTQQLSLMNIAKNKLDDIAEIIRSDIESNLYNSKEYLGQAAAPNKPSTIRRKGHGIVFLDKGILRKSVANRKTGEYEREIFINGIRKQIAVYLQFGTNRMQPRPFFGISENALNKIKEIIQKK